MPSATDNKTEIISKVSRKSIRRGSSVVQSEEDPHRVVQGLLRNLIHKKTFVPEDLEAVLDVTISRVVETIGAKAICILMADFEERVVHFRNVFFSPSLYIANANKKAFFKEKAASLLRSCLRLGKGLIGESIATGQMRWVRAIARQEASAQHHEKYWGFIPDSLVVVPMKFAERTVGCLQAMKKSDDPKTPSSFSNEDLKVLEEAATYAAQILQQAADPEFKFGENEMAQCIARLTNNPYLAITEQTQLENSLITQLGETVLRRYQILPLAKLDDREIRCAVANPLDYTSLEDFEIVTGFKVVEKVVAASGQIESAIDRALVGELPRHVNEVADSIALEFDVELSPDLDISEHDNENSAPVVRLVNRIFEDAYLQGASDIHIEPYEKSLMVRYRIDGHCVEKLQLPQQLHRSLVSRIKVMASMDIAERRMPQDGRIVYKRFNNRYDLDLRVSVAPMNYGESVCLRILDKVKSALPLDKLGFSEYNLERYRQALKTPYGMILHCGPTGSGKSMTLYAALNEVNGPDIKICTAEDPIEYTCKGVNQLQVHQDIGLTFAAALRCFLRQDPDILLVGEIRDQETAEIAVEAALTGHLLFSTLHTNDASSTVIRLTEMGIEPYLLSTSLIGVCAQRLLRKLCSCAESRVPDDATRAFLDRAKSANSVDQCRYPNGCQRCGRSGYKGRTGIHELLLMSDELRALINRGANTDQIKAVAREEGMRTLFEDALEKVKAGITCMPEALGTARPD